MYINFSLNVLNDEEKAILFHILNTIFPTFYDEHKSFVFTSQNIHWINPEHILKKLHQARDKANKDSVSKIDMIFSKLKAECEHVISPIDGELAVSGESATPAKDQLKKQKKKDLVTKQETQPI